MTIGEIPGAGELTSLERRIVRIIAEMGDGAAPTAFALACWSVDVHGDVDDFAESVEAVNRLIEGGWLSCCGDVRVHLDGTQQRVAALLATGIDEVQRRFLFELFRSKRLLRPSALSNIVLERAGYFDILPKSMQLTYTRTGGPYVAGVILTTLVEKKLAIRVGAFYDVSDDQRRALLRLFPEWMTGRYTGAMIGSGDARVATVKATRTGRAIEL
jgi:hypothetical protein